MRLLIAFFTWSLLLAAPYARASNEYLAFPNHSKAALLSSHTEVGSQEEVWVALHIKLDPGWHTYWKNPGDSGAAPLFDMRSSSPAITFGQIEWPTPKRIPTPPLSTFGYENEVLFRAEVLGLAEADQKEIEIQWEVEWLVCKVECIPAFHKFSLSVLNSGRAIKSPSFELITAPDFQSYPSAEPLNISYMELPGQILINFKGPTEEADFFPASAVEISNEPPLTTEKGLLLKRFAPLREQPLEGLLLSPEGAQYLVAVPERSPPSLWPYLLGAFLGGLILNLMPCVFPIISLKVFSALRLEGSSLRQRAAHLSFVAGVLTCFFLVAGLLAALRAAGYSLGWGFQLQSPGFLLFLIFLFFTLSLNFLGLYELNLPGLKGTQGGEGPSGSFLSGALAVVVASPCTAPFMGGAMGFAMTQNTVTLLLIFASLGIGFSAPYIVLAVFPVLLSRLPRSGAWLETFRKMMFFPMLWTTLWLLWIYAQITGITSATWVMVALSLVAGLFWWQAFPATPGRRAAQVAMAALLVASGYLLWTRQDSSSPAEGRALKSVSIPWMEFDPAELDRLIQAKEPVFLSFTASWCITCKVNEQVTFKSSEVAGFVREHNIKMMVADWTRRDPEITRFLEQHDRISIPFYLFWSGEQETPLVLPEILTPQIFMNTLKNHHSS